MKQRVFKQVGAELFGPLLESFALWLHEQARADGVEKLFFLSRDGYMMERAYEAVIPAREQVPHRYMYASRRMLNFASITQLDERALNYLGGDQAAMRVDQYLERVGLRASDDVLVAAGFAQGNATELKRRDSRRLRRLWETVEPQVLEQAARERSVVIDYLTSLADWESGKCAVVDIGWHGSMQRAVAELLGLKEGKLRGYYLGLHGRAQTAGGPKLAYFPRGRGSGRWNWEILELCFAERDRSVVGVKRRGKRFVSLRERFEPPKFAMEAARVLQDAAVEHLHRSKPRYSSRAQVLARIDRLMTRPTPAEAAAFGDLPHHEPLGSYGQFMPLARPRRSLAGYLVHPVALKNDLRASYWHRGFLARLKSGS